MLSRVRALLHTPEPPALGPEVRPHAQAADPLNLALGDLAREGGWPPLQAATIRAAVLLWHDHLEAAHRVVQDLEHPDAHWVHALMHRREPDYANAKYWYRRVGAHPGYHLLATSAGPFLEQTGQADFARRLLPNGCWDPLAFVDECRLCADLAPGDPRVLQARELQRLEFDALFHHLCP